MSIKWHHSGTMDNAVSEREKKHRELAKKAAAEAGKFCRVSVIGTPSRAQVPHPDSINVPNDAAYLYYCMNETVNGMEFNYIPQCPECVPLVSDVSSDFLSRPIDFKRHALVFAGAQKNFGPAGLTVVILRKDLLGLAGDTCPTMLNYQIHAEAASMYNTPPTFAIWVANLVCKWLIQEGGVEVMNERARARSSLVYKTIDESGGFYVNTIPERHRSRMNVVFTLAESALTDLFIKEADAAVGMSRRSHDLKFKISDFQSFSVANKFCRGTVFGRYPESVLRSFVHQFRIGFRRIDRHVYFS